MKYAFLFKVVKFVILSAFLISIERDYNDFATLLYLSVKCYYVCFAVKSGNGSKIMTYARRIIMRVNQIIQALQKFRTILII